MNIYKNQIQYIQNPIQNQKNKNIDTNYDLKNEINTITEFTQSTTNSEESIIEVNVQKNEYIGKDGPYALYIEGDNIGSNRNRNRIPSKQNISRNHSNQKISRNPLPSPNPLPSYPKRENLIRVPKSPIPSPRMVINQKDIDKGFINTERNERKEKIIVPIQTQNAPYSNRNNYYYYEQQKKNINDCRQNYHKINHGHIRNEEQRDCKRIINPIGKQKYNSCQRRPFKNERKININNNTFNNDLSAKKFDSFMKMNKVPKYKDENVNKQNLNINNDKYNLLLFEEVKRDVVEVPTFGVPSPLADFY